MNELQLKAKARRRRAEAEKEVFEPNRNAIFNAARESGYVKGYTDLPSGAGQLLFRISDSVYGTNRAPLIDALIQREEKAYQQNREDDGIDWARMGGQMTNPIGLAMMAAPGSQATLATRMGAGMAAGGGFAAAQPVAEGDYGKVKAIQTGMGAGFGGAIPVIGSGLRAGGNYLDELIKPLTKRGIIRDVEKFIREHAGTGKEKIIAALRNARKGQTSGQAIATANRATRELGEPDSFGGQYVALEKDLAKQPITGDKLKRVYETQQAGRENVLKAIAGTDDALNAAKATRASRSDKLYKKAWQEATRADPDLAKIASNPYFKDQIPKAMKLRQAEGSTSLTKFLHDVKIGLDKELSKTGNEALDSAQQKAVQNVKNSIVKWLEKKNPAYDEARKVYAELSAPINKMEVGRELQRKLVSPTDQESILPFTRAIAEPARTIKNATGYGKISRYEDVIGKDSTQAVKRVADELIDQVKTNKMGTQTKSVLPELGGEITFSLPRILSRPIVITNAILRQVGINKSPEYKEILTKFIRDPKEMERILMSESTGPMKKMAVQVLNDLERASALAATSETGREE